MSRTEELLTKIRELQGLNNAILPKISVDKKTMTAEFVFITDSAYGEDTVRNVNKILSEYAPENFTATAKIVKRVPDEETIKQRIVAFMGNRFPAASAFLNEDDIHIEMQNSGAIFCFDIASGDEDYFSSSNILDEVSKYLSSVYCGAYLGNVRLVEKQHEEVDLEDYSGFEDAPLTVVRTFDICDFAKIDGVDEEIPKKALYIADIPSGEQDGLVFCGKLAFVQERESKSGKTYYQMSINDGTGTLRFSYFPKKATVDKIKELKVDDEIVLIGANEIFKDMVSFTAKKINYGRQPENFVPERKPSKPVPKNYHTVFPEPVADYTQSGFFDNYEKPEVVKNNVFVVFDLETTGLNNNPSMGKMDRIIEFGAVKVINGEITEKFSSFVACPDRLSEKIVELTGIHDEDLVGAPEVGDVIADFYKFVQGAYLVGHNVQFDYRFVKYYGEENDYVFENKEFDTWEIAQEVMPGELVNYKLDTIADHFGFTFNHHRAFEDAITTAKVFIELMKKKKTLPL